MGKALFLILQSEGAEVDAQYNRLLRTILDENGYQKTDILAPFVEDILFKSPAKAVHFCLALLAGDLINLAPLERQAPELEYVLNLVDRGVLNIQALQGMAGRIKGYLLERNAAKSILVLGEPAVLYNDHLNNYHLRDIQKQGHRLVLGPMSEAIWLLWTDYLNQNPTKVNSIYRLNLKEFAKSISTISSCLGGFSPFEDELKTLVQQADLSVGLYAGSHGRYRHAKQSGSLVKSGVLDGVITLASTYENTSVALGIIQRASQNGLPVLNLTFDGNQDENQQAKIESFIHYL